MFDMVSFAFWVIKALVCEAVNFPKFESAGVPVMLFDYLDAPVLFIAHAPCRARAMRMPNVLSQGSHMMRTTSP